jgi:hypothetical protein
VDGKIVIGDSGEGIAEVDGRTDEGVGGVCAGTFVVGSDGAAAAVIAVFLMAVPDHSCSRGDGWLQSRRYARTQNSDIYVQSRRKFY